MPTNSSKRARSPSANGDKPSKRAKSVVVSKGSNKKHGQRVDLKSDNEESNVSEESDSESDGECEIPPKDLKSAGRTIARCCDLFCDVHKAVDSVLLAKQEPEDSDEERDLLGSEDESTHENRRKKALDRITPKALARYKKVYSTLICEIPSMKTLINDPSRKSMLKKALKKVNKAISETRSSDSARLREKLPTYILPNPKVDVMKPAVNGSTGKSELGLSHPQLGGYLCPVESVAVYHEDIEKTLKRLERGDIDIAETELPAFLWEANGANYDDTDKFRGLFHGFYLERVTRHIFTGPSTAHGDDARRVRSCNAILHQMEKVEAVHIAYAAVLARYTISSQPRWSEKDGRFNYRRFYYSIIELIEDYATESWRKELLKDYNVLLFKNGEGRGVDFTTAKDDTTKKGGFLSRLRAQGAMRESIPPAAGFANPTPPPTSPQDTEVDDASEPGRGPPRTRYFRVPSSSPEVEHPVPTEREVHWQVDRSHASAAIRTRRDEHVEYPPAHTIPTTQDEQVERFPTTATHTTPTDTRHDERAQKSPVPGPSSSAPRDAPVDTTTGSATHGHLSDLTDLEGDERGGQSVKSVGTSRSTKRKPGRPSGEAARSSKRNVKQGGKSKK